MGELTNILEQLLHQLTRLSLPAATRFRPGLSVREIEEKLDNFPFKLSRETYELYQWANGIQSVSLCPGIQFRSIDEYLGHYQESMYFAQQNFGFVEEYTSYLGWNSRWFPILDSEGKEFYIVEGCEQQQEISPISIVDIENSGHITAYDNISDLMLEIAECYETGAFYIDNNGKIKRNSLLRAQIRQKYR